MSESPFQQFARALYETNGEKPTLDGGGGTVRCPAHDDHNPSLAVTEGDDGRLLLQCHAGCQFTDIMQAVGLTVADAFPRSNGNGKHRPNIVTTYDYLDEAGKLLYQVCRYEPKGFKQRRPDGKGGWTWKTKGIRQVLYRLPELLKADPSKAVFIVEGEKDADRLRSIGLVATCNPGGAGKWRSEYSESLKGRPVVVLPDDDKAGNDHAESIVRSLDRKAASAKVVELPGLFEKGDVSDWLDGGGTVADLLALVDETDEWEPTAEEPLTFGPVVRSFADIEPRSVDWTWEYRIACGRLTGIVGRPGCGKSFATCDFAARISTGTPWPDGKPCQKGSVLFITCEDDPADTIRPRLDAHGADVSRIHILDGVQRTDEDGEIREVMFSLHDVVALETAIRRKPDLRLIIIDPVGSFIGGRTDTHKDSEVRAVLAPVAKLAEQYNVAVLAVMHTRKAPSASADDTVLGSRGFVGLARAVWHLFEDDNNKNRRLLLPGKNNLAEAQPGLAFSINGEPPKVTWEPEPVHMHANEIAAAIGQPLRPGPDDVAQREAEAFLRDALSNGSRLARDVEDQATQGHDISKSTLKRAKKKVGVEAFREEIPGPWWWRLSKGTKGTNGTKGEQLDHLDPLAKNKGKTAVLDDEKAKGTKLLESDPLGDCIDD